MTDSETGPNGGRKERFRVAGDKLLSTVRNLIREGNVRHVVIKNDDGDTLIEFPVSIGVAGAVLVPVWAAVGAIAAIVTNCTIEIERTDQGDDADQNDVDEVEWEEQATEE